MRIIKKTLRELRDCVLKLGYAGENEYTRIVLDCAEVYAEYPAAVPAVTVQPPHGDAYPAVIRREDDCVLWDVTDSDLAENGKGEMQLTFTENGVVVKSCIAHIAIDRSLDPTGEIPEPIENWLVAANTALNAIPETIEDALEAAKESGEFDGADGFSPIATVTKAGKTATITITDANGTTSATVTDGEDGQDGHSPALTASKSGKTTTLYADGEELAEILDGADGTDIIDDTAGAGDTDKTWSADKVVSELGGVQDLVALPYEELTFPVAMNALCVHDGKLYKSITAIQTEEAWTPSHWYDVTGGKAVTGLYTGLDGIGAALASKYTKPAGGIPATDLASGVIPDVSGKADKADTVLETTLSHGRKNNTTVGADSIAYGTYVTASGAQSQAFGSGTTASGTQSHAEGGGTTASGTSAHAEGSGTYAAGNYSHAEGGGTHADGEQSHAEGGGTTASGTDAHSEGGSTQATGDYSHAEGTGTIANHKAQHAGGEWNVADPSSAAATARGTYAEIIGNGTSYNARSNARTLDWSGNEELAGDLTVKKGTADEVSISTLKSALNAIEDAVIVEKAIHENEDISAQLSYDANTYVTDAGYRGSSTSYKCTEKIPVTEGMTFKTTYQTDWRYVCAYNGDTVITAKGGANLSTYTVPAGITHIIITLYSTVNTGSRAVIKQFDKEWIENNLTDELKATEADLDSVKSATTEKTVTQKETDLSTKISYITGQYINKTGYNGADASYNRTNKISVKEGEVYKTSYQTDWRFVCAYEGETAVSDKGAEYVRTYTVPEGVTHIVITLASSVSLTQRAIIKVDPFVDYENSASKIVPSFVKRGARVTFIDDDGYAEFYTHFKPIMQEYGIPMCPAYMGDVCPTFVNTAYMTEEQCKEIESLGGEILVHGGTNLTTLTLAQAEANVLASKNALLAHGFKSDVYVYPNGANNIEIREMMAKHFKCAFKTAAPQKLDTRVNDKCVPHYFIHRCSAGGYFDDKSADYGNYDTWTLDYFKALVDDAIAKNGWLVFMTHAWMMPIGCSYRLEHDAGNGVPADLDEFALIEDIIEYIQTKKNNGDDIEIVTASEGFEMFGNEVQSGDYLGWWNEKYTGTYQNMYWHNKAGFAVNKVGDIDFADGNRISHT